VLKDRFDSASPTEKKMLAFMADSAKDTFKPIEIKDALKMKNASYVRNSLKRLVEKDCLKRVGQGEYRFFHKLFKLYVQDQFKSA
jgi:predicted transcriptional regulator of viral defense system